MRSKLVLPVKGGDSFKIKYKLHYNFLTRRLKEVDFFNNLLIKEEVDPVRPIINYDLHESLVQGDFSDVPSDIVSTVALIKKGNAYAFRFKPFGGSYQIKGISMRALVFSVDDKECVDVPVDGNLSMGAGILNSIKTLKESYKDYADIVYSLRYIEKLLGKYCHVNHRRNSGEINNNPMKILKLS